MACMAARPLQTYHFIIDFMEMNLTDFLHNIFILKRDKAKPYRKKENKKTKNFKTEGVVSSVPASHMFFFDVLQQ